MNFFTENIRFQHAFQMLCFCEHYSYVKLLIIVLKLYVVRTEKYANSNEYFKAWKWLLFQFLSQKKRVMKYCKKSVH